MHGEVDYRIYVGYDVQSNIMMNNVHSSEIQNVSAQCQNESLKYLKNDSYSG
jgi:hypothetical protein